MNDDLVKARKDAKRVIRRRIREKTNELKTEDTEDGHDAEFSDDDRVTQTNQYSELLPYIATATFVFVLTYSFFFWCIVYKNVFQT